MDETLTLSFLMFLFDPSKNTRKPNVFLCFQGNQNGPSGRKGLNYRYQSEMADQGKNSKSCFQPELLLNPLSNNPTK